ncbi:MAG: hypothetical protein NW201_14770 [Gemmatimonadales bacterium]|nr:hypothetical protein [Gemmatimonadales bacterium]
MSDDDPLQRAFRADLARQHRAPADAPTPEELLALAEGAGDDPARLAALDAVLASAEGAREFGLARAAVVASAEPVPAAAGARVAPWARPGLLALAAAMVLGIGITLLRPRAEPLRGGAALEVVGPPAGAVRDGTVLAWRGVAGATGYRVELYEADGRSVIDARTPDTVFALPAGALQPGRDYVWSVRALFADGRVLASPPRPLRRAE